MKLFIKVLNQKAQKYSEQGIVFTPLIKSGSTIEIYSQKQ